jgi:hypothetical protein
MPTVVVLLTTQAPKCMRDGNLMTADTRRTI